MSDDEVLVGAWQRQRELSAAAGKRKSEQSRWRSIALAALVAGAVLETVALQLDGGSAAQRTLAIAGAVALAVVPVVQARKLPPNAVLEWTRLRSASEAVKSEIYRYLASVTPYRDESTRRDALMSETEAILARVSDLGHHVATVELSHAPPPEQMSAADYLERRVATQVREYYEPQAKKNGRRLARLRSIELILAIVAAALAAVAAVGPASVSGWVAVVTTTAGAIAAHREATRVEQQAISYHATAKQLDSLRRKWSSRVGDGALTATREDELVEECEGAISIENKGWMAMWTDAALPTGR